jgi:hypothetical protein
MAFAMFYNHQDSTAIAANIEASLVDARLTNQERQVAQRAWNGGLKNWSTAPVAPLDRQEGDPDTRIIIVDGPQVSLQALINLLLSLSVKIPGALYMSAIADDLSRSSGAVEPWPPV